ALTTPAMPSAKRAPLARTAVPAVPLSESGHTLCYGLNPCTASLEEWSKARAEPQPLENHLLVHLSFFPYTPPDFPGQQNQEIRPYPTLLRTLFPTVALIAHH